MDINLSSDQPVKKATEDKFQRYNFSKRIADTIKDRKSEECIVVGIYGSWGEGKTSVLNFIETELNNDADTVILKFNPWRYQDENILLMQFFNKLAASVDVNVKNNKEKVGDFLKKYGKLISIEIPFVGNLGEKLKDAGDILDAEDVELLKFKVNEVIKDTGKRFVVVIDDIDRLDKNEIHAIFRLVKLSADFSNTTYILSFDEKMVAAAIGDRFGAGGMAAGMSFLEKIIQVPLRIPIVRRQVIENFCMEQIQEILKSNNILLNDRERTKFTRNFIDAILPKLLTPRLATRYCNTLSFSLPLLKGEVNMVDLMLIEALKIFYPDLYNFVRFNPAFFTDKDYKSEENNFKTIGLFYEVVETQKGQVGYNMLELFLYSLFPTSVHFAQLKNTDVEEYTAYKAKLISSPQYFERYFTYDVTKGDLSDVTVFNLVKKLPEQSEAEQNGAIKTVIECYPANLLLRKVSTDFNSYNDSEIELLFLSLARSSSAFPLTDTYEGWGLLSATENCAQIMVNYILLMQGKEGVKLWINNIMLSADSLTLVMLLRINLLREDFTNKSVPKNDGNSTWLNNLVIKAAIRLAEDKSIFDAFPDDTDVLLQIWEDTDLESYHEYLADWFVKDELLFLKVIKHYTLKEKDEQNENGVVYFDLSRDHYDLIVSMVNKDQLKLQIEKYYSKEQLATPVKWNPIKHRPSYTQTDLNLALQFMHHYEDKPIPQHTSVRFT